MVQAMSYLKKCGDPTTLRMRLVSPKNGSNCDASFSCELLALMTTTRQTFKTYPIFSTRRPTSLRPPFPAQKLTPSPLFPSLHHHRRLRETYPPAVQRDSLFRVNPRVITYFSLQTNRSLPGFPPTPLRSSSHPLERQILRQIVLVENASSRELTWGKGLEIASSACFDLGNRK